MDPESAFPKYYSGAVVIETKDGRTLSHREQINRGAAENPFTPNEVKDKFRANASSAMTADETDKILQRVLEMDTAENISGLANGLMCVDTAR